MDNAGYTALTRQSGLVRELQIVANNIANTTTTGFRSEDLLFSEFVQDMRDAPSLSMATANVRQTSMLQGQLTETGSDFDFAIEGDGFFLVQTPAGERLTRAGSFALNQAGDLVTHDGYPVLDPGGAPLFIPPDVESLDVGPDGTMSSEGRILGQLALVRPTDPQMMTREGGVLFASEAGYDPDPDSRISQGFLEGSNVNALAQVARLVEVQRAYEMGQSFMEAENERIRNTIQTLIKRG